MTVVPRVDPIAIEVIASRIREIAATMEHALYHSGYSPILRESKDGTAGLTDADGRVVVVSGGLQYHSLPYQKAVEGVIARYPRESLAPGESFVVNDPYRGGNPHVPDFVAVTPAFHDGRVVGFGVSVAHKADVGGLVPGSSGAGSRSIYHDGMLIPPVRFQTAAGVDESVEAIIRNNSRIPDLVLGDLRSQVGCTRAGAARIAALCEEYGGATVVAVMREVLERTGMRLRAELAALPDGEAEAEGFLDHDGARTDRPVRIHVRAVKRGDRLTLDFSGSSPQTEGPINANATTVQACALIAVLAATDPTIPINAGLSDAVAFVMPEGLVIAPRHPASVNHYLPTCHVAFSCVLAALGQLGPARAVAPSGFGMSGVAIGYRMPQGAKPAVQYEVFCTALGGTSDADGCQIVQPINHMTPGTPVEILEGEYPIRVRRFDLRPDSGGPGRRRGGLGYVREYEVLRDCVLTLRGSNHRFAAPGLAGGASPLPSHATINPGRDGEAHVGPIATRDLHAGDVFRLEQSGGAGYGDPFERPPADVLADVRAGYVSAAAAAERYGVVVHAGAVDDAATAALRAR